ncbi:MAG: DUF4124 domain-containing protein [Burkholderiaceae bacterium]|nr:DUF4124 domain-containing protein [Burkholderiaceae bacterium]
MKSHLLGAMFTLLALLAQPATAQWQYKDEKGQTVFSDQPPPASVKRSDIIKGPPGFDAKPLEGTSSKTVKGPSSAARPNYEAAAATTPAANAAAVNTAGTPPAADKKTDDKPLTTAEKELEYQKRKKAEAEAQAKSEAEAQAARDKQQACNMSRESLRSLESGIRMMTVNEKGERIPIDDEERNKRTARAREAVAKSCSN